MGNPLGAVGLIILLLFGYITGPIYSSYDKQDTYVNNYVKVAANDFQKQVRNSGYIDAKMYNSFLDKLNRTKRIYKVELTYTHELIYPDNTNNFKAYYIDHGNTEIFNTIYKNNQKYFMKYGDDFNVKVSEAEAENSQLLLSSVYFFSTPAVKLSFNYGGMVENEP